jgi:hypothetical protein
MNPPRHSMKYAPGDGDPALEDVNRGFHGRADIRKRAHSHRDVAGEGMQFHCGLRDDAEGSF